MFFQSLITFFFIFVNLIPKHACFTESFITQNVYNPLKLIFEAPDSLTVSSNHTFEINTTNMNPECTPECYLNCQAQFPDIIQEKYCIINVCKCEIINESTTVTNQRQATFLSLKKSLFNSSLRTDWSFITRTLWFIVFIGIYEIFVLAYYYFKVNSKEVFIGKDNSETIINNNEQNDYSLYQRLIGDEQY